MPASNGPRSSCLKSSANSYASLWHQLSRPADDAVALAQDCSQGSAHLPSAGPGAALFPGELTFFFFFLFGYRGIVHPPSNDEGTERTWLEPEQRPRKRVPKRSVHGKQSPQGASHCMALAVSGPVSLRPSATCSSHALSQPQSLTGCVALARYDRVSACVLSSQLLAHSPRAEPERLGSGSTTGTPSKPVSQALAIARSPLPAGLGSASAHAQAPHPPWRRAGSW